MHMNFRVVAALAVGFGLSACGSDSSREQGVFTAGADGASASAGSSDSGISGDGDASASGTATASGSGTATAGDTSTAGDGDGDGDAGDSGTTGGLKFDVPEAGEVTSEDGDPVDTGCKKIDLLISVDASSSMESEIESLPPTFIAIKDILRQEVGDGIEDFHVAVMNACPDPAYMHNWGAGRTDCNFPTGRNYLDSTVDTNIDSLFSCVVDIPLQDEALDEKGGRNGGYNDSPDFCADGPDEDEQPALTCAEAIQPGVSQNAGFVRDDAILLLVAITDEDEALANIGSPQQIHDRILAAKGGNEEVVTFLGIGGDGCQSAYDGDNVFNSRDLRDTANAFGTRGLFRTMCGNGDPIRDAFEEALTTVVDQACRDFIPPAG